MGNKGHLTTFLSMTTTCSVNYRELTSANITSPKSK